MRDEELRALEQAAARGDPDAAEQLLTSRYRRGELPERHLELAAYLGCEPALSLRPELRPLTTLPTQPWVDGLGRFGRAILGRALLGLARELSPREVLPEELGELSLVPLRPSATPKAIAPGQTLTIGRSRSADLILNDDRVSRRHCELELRTDGRLLVRDLESTNGTFLGSVPLLEETPLHVGQILRLGTGALLEVRQGHRNPTPHERCLAATQAALDDPRPSLLRATSEAADAIAADTATPELEAAFAAAYAVAGSDVLAGLYVAGISPARCRKAAREALLPWIISGGTLPPELPLLESRWRSQRLSNTNWSELSAAIESAFQVRVWAPLGECDPRRHAQLIVQRLPASEDPGSEEGGIEILHLVDLQGIDPEDLSSLHDWTQLRHPHLASVRHVETRRLLVYYPPCWFAREDFRGGVPVKTWLEESAPSHLEIAQLGLELAGALEPLLGVVRRWNLATLTPDDVVVGPQGGLWRGLVARAAISTLEDLQDDAFRHREMHIDLRYLTPEQATEATLADPARVVVYQLGAILYTLLARRPPFPIQSPPTARVLLEILDRPAVSLLGAVEHLDPALDAIVLGCLAKDPTQRPTSPTALASELAGWIQSQR